MLMTKYAGEVIAEMAGESPQFYQAFADLMKVSMSGSYYFWTKNMKLSENEIDGRVRRTALSVGLTEDILEKISI